MPGVRRIKEEISMIEQRSELPEIAFYYPGHLWYRRDWIKNLLLFFDGVGLLVPQYKKAEPELLDPVIAGPLRERGMLHVFESETWVDKEATEHLAAALTEFITSGAFDSLNKDGTAFHEISRSRMGYYGDPGLADMLFQELRQRGLARDSEDGVSIPMHPAIRYLILVLLAQILRPKGSSLGLDLSPITDRFQVVRALTEFLELPTVPSAGHVVTFDLQNVAVDLSLVPLDEVLSFRTSHKEAHRNDIRSVRRFARELSLMPEQERVAAFAERQAELDELASDLKRIARAAWKRPVSFAVSIAGAAWTAITGDPIGALLAAGATLAAGMGKESKEVGAFSYLFAAHERYA
jgi:hypothetical protein